MESHGDLVPNNSHIVAAEQFLCAAIYAQKVKEAYQEAYHYTVAWDPSNYDVETLVSIIHSTQAGDTPDGLAAYLPIQNMKPVLKQEVCDEIRALSHSLKAVGMPLEKFVLGKAVKWQPLKEFETRVFEENCWWIKNSRTGAKERQLPENFDICRTPILRSLSDQGGINRAGLDYLCWKLGLSIHIAFDPGHRSWNDVKQSFRSSKGDLWKCLLSFSLLFNVNYGPFGSKQWHQKKQQKAHEFLQTASAHQEPFLSFIPFICAERQIAEPSTAAEREQLLQTLADCNSIRTLGPVVKLMRFFSFFQSAKFFEGEIWFNKLVMLETDKFTVTEGASYVRSEEYITLKDSTTMTDKQELQQLKQKHGSWGLAPLLVTPASFWQKEAIVLLANPCWHAHSWMCKNVLTPTQTAVYIMDKSKGSRKAEILEQVLQGFCSTSNLKRLYPFQGCSESTMAKRLEIHFDLVANLMARRGSSLSAQYLRPSIRYSNLLSTHQPEALALQQQMLADWKLLLDLEAQDLSGKHVRALSSLHFLQGAICRLCFLLNEDDCNNNTHQAASCIKPLIVNFGDTICVENTHQSAKDNLRESRHNVSSRVNKQCAVLNSRLFQSRQTPHVSIPELELTLRTTSNLPAFAPMTHPNGHAMQKEFQQMMMHKAGEHFWPSTSALSQFEEVVALEYLLKKCPLDAPQLSCLVGHAGSVIASHVKGLVGLVLSKTQSGFLLWAMEPVPDRDPVAYRCVPQESALQFSHVNNLDEWVEIPVQPSLHKEHGALVLQKVGDPMSLANARIAQGLDLTVKQAKEVLFACGVSLPGQPNKAQVYKALIEQFVKGDEHVQKALELSKAKTDQEEEDEEKLSELGELIDLLEADTEMQHDPDVRQDQQKLKRRRLAKPKVKEGELLLMPQGSGRGKGRGRGRPKGKGKGRGKGRGRRAAKAKAKNTNPETQPREATSPGNAQESNEALVEDPLPSPTSPADEAPEFRETPAEQAKPLPGPAPSSSEPAAPQPPSEEAAHGEPAIVAPVDEQSMFGGLHQ